MPVRPPHFSLTHSNTVEAPPTLRSESLPLTTSTSNLAPRPSGHSSHLSPPPLQHDCTQGILCSSPSCSCSHSPQAQSRRLAHGITTSSSHIHLRVAFVSVKQSAFRGGAAPYLLGKLVRPFPFRGETLLTRYM